jgi:hypothetical protein
MAWRELERLRPWRSAARFAVATLVLAGAGSVFGCEERVATSIEPGDSKWTIDRLQRSAIDQIDLLLVIDNSGSMSDKQDILATTVPDLVQSLVNPRCIDARGVGAPVTPPAADDRCPDGLYREFPPILDIHIGIISSSLGGHGAATCTRSDSVSNVDMAHLLARRDASSVLNDIPTYQGKGFLAWDPAQKLDGKENEPDANDGEADIDEPDTDRDLNSSTLVGSLRDMVKGVGQSGCGFEAQLESVYRFLADPEPYENISVQDDTVVVEGVDRTVLAQRRDFLRANSLLAILLLTDENDCSIREEGSGYLAASHRTTSNAQFHLWRPRSECALNPNDPCCRSCNQPAGECAPDPGCFDADGTVRQLSEQEDRFNLRCFDQKRRFGFDFLYPIDRYTKAFTEWEIADRAGNLVPNPIFSDLDPNDGEISYRNAGLVFFAGIVGVPWQDLARQDADGRPDLSKGLDAGGNAVGGFKSPDELFAPVAGQASTWELILGDPDNYVRPGDPHMHEQVGERAGANPITGATIAPSSSVDPEADPISGRERAIVGQDDLQYACVFPLPGNGRLCEPGTPCDCEDPRNDNPLCADDGMGGRTLQVKAKAYPGIRELQVIKALGSQGLVGSVCPEQLDESRKGEPSYGYRPALRGLTERLRPTLGGGCWSRTLEADAQGRVSCVILEARNARPTCDCDDGARLAVPEEHRALLDVVLADPLVKHLGWSCVCELEQLDGDALKACQETVPPAPVQTEAGDVDGWCYVDATSNPPIGNPEIAASCPKTDRRILHFVGAAEPLSDSTLFIACHGD